MEQALIECVDQSETNCKRKMQEAPELKIEVQPEGAFTFRENSTTNALGKLRGKNNSFPRVKLHNYSENATVFVRAVLGNLDWHNVLSSYHGNEQQGMGNYHRDYGDPQKYHELIFTDGIAANEMALNSQNNHTAIFDNLSIRKLKMKDVKVKVMSRLFRIHNVPFEGDLVFKKKYWEDRNGPVKHELIESGKLYKEMKDQIVEMRLSQCRLEFYACDENFNILGTSVFTDIISDKKTVKDLNIERINKYKSPASGNKELWIIASPLPDKKIYVCFHEESTGWTEKVLAGKSEIQKKFLIVIKTPPYFDNNITQPVEVSIKLQSFNNPSNISDPHTFKYVPNDSGPQGIEKLANKRISSEDLDFDLGSIPKKLKLQLPSNNVQLPPNKPNNIQLPPNNMQQRTPESLATAHQLTPLVDDKTEQSLPSLGNLDGNFSITSADLVQLTENSVTNTVPAMLDANAHSYQSVKFLFVQSEQGYWVNMFGNCASHQVNQQQITSTGNAFGVFNQPLSGVQSTLQGDCVTECLDEGFGNSQPPNVQANEVVAGIGVLGSGFPGSEITTVQNNEISNNWWNDQATNAIKKDVMLSNNDNGDMGTPVGSIEEDDSVQIDSSFGDFLRGFEIY